jgi:hypothetical protein
MIGAKFDAHFARDALSKFASAATAAGSHAGKVARSAYKHMTADDTDKEKARWVECAELAWNTDYPDILSPVLFVGYDRGWMLWSLHEDFSSPTQVVLRRDPPVA